MRQPAAEWIKKAEQDFLVAKREYEAKPSACEAVCFHSQQCIEKYLKAILQENNIFFEKTHDLDVLLEKSKVFIPELYKLKERLVELSAFAVEIRYPGVEATEEEAENSILILEQARKIIRGYFKA